MYVGQSDSCHYSRLAPHHAADAVVGQHALAHDPSDPAHARHDQQLAEISLAHFAHSAKPRLAGGRVLSRD